MADVDTPFAEPMSMEEALAAQETLQAQDTSEVEEEQKASEEEDQSAEEQSEVEEELEAESEADEDEGPQVLTLDEYGDVSIEIDGEVITLAELAQGNLRQSDYTRKRQADAEAAKARKAELDQREAELAEREQRTSAQLAEYEEQEPDWVKLAEEDPLGVITKKVQWDKKQAEIAAAREQKRAEQEQALAKFRAATAAEAVKTFPEWSDGSVFQAGASARRDLALKLGFTEQEYGETHDFRLAALLEMAVQSQKTLPAKEVAQKRLAKAPKVLKPGAKVTQGEKQVKADSARQERLRQPMSMEEALKLAGG